MERVSEHEMTHAYLPFDNRSIEPNNSRAERSKPIGHYEHISVKPCAGVIGAQIGNVDLTRELPAVVVGEIEQALLQYEVIFFRNQDISPEDHLRFGHLFGGLARHPVLPHLPNYPDIVVLDSDGPNAPVEEWHTDVTFEKCPPLGAILHGAIVPEHGGDTLWASMTAAYEGLSTPLKTMCDGLSAEHSFTQGFRHTLARAGGYEKYRDVIASSPPVVHPLVRTHPVKGTKSLFVNGLFTAKIVGMSELESRYLLELLCHHITTPEYTVRLRWEQNTIAFWDNRCTQHRPINDFYPARRRMQRIVINGDRPF